MGGRPGSTLQGPFVSVLMEVLGYLKCVMRVFVLESDLVTNNVVPLRRINNI